MKRLYLRSLLVVFAILFSFQLHTIRLDNSPLVINEILFKESSNNQEWVEIYNRSDSEIVMDNYYLLDAANTKTVFSGVIAPKTYMIICRDKDRFLNFYPYVSENKIIESTSWAILNNDRETLMLIGSNGNIYDFMEYTAPASYPADLSLERVNPYDDESEWLRCIHPNMSTPAEPNSHLPLKYDIALIDVQIIAESNFITHYITVSDVGYMNTDAFTFECFAYYDESIDGELLYVVDDIFQQREQIVSFTTSLPVAEYVTYRYIVSTKLDMNLKNNTILTYFCNGALPVVVNEVMFRPLDNEPKWIEMKINKRYKYLNSMSLKTRRNIVCFNLDTVSDYIILTNTTADSSYMYNKYNLVDTPIYTGLGDLYVTVEELTVYDPSENIIEHFSYDADWSKERGVSIERINPNLPTSAENWSHSIATEGSTPGRTNSIFTPFIPTQTTLSISPNPFSPTRGEHTIMSFEFPERLSRVTCRIFDLKGRLVNKITNQEIFAANGAIIWDGSRDNGNRLPVGIYIVHLEGVGLDTEKVFRERQTVVIAR